MPGVLSARWAGPPKSDLRNNELLLAQLDDVPDERRGAHFACAVAFVHPDGTELVVHGEMRGRVIRELRGSGGFGYDVLFVADEHPSRRHDVGGAVGRGEGRDLPPRPGAARDRAVGRGGVGLRPPAAGGTRRADGG